MEINSTDIIINPSIKNVYGFLILSSFSVLIGTVSKDKAEINFEQKINNKDLRPIIKRRKGSSSFIRFWRYFIEKQERITKYIDELLEQCFIKDNMINISGLIIAGPNNPIQRYLASKNRKLTMNKFITSIIELENDGKLGFNEAIVKSMIKDNL